MQQEYNKEPLTSEEYIKIISEKDDIIQDLSNSLNELNDNNADMFDKLKALQNEYNKVCYQRDVLIELLDKFTNK